MLNNVVKLRRHHRERRRGKITSATKNACASHPGGARPIEKENRKTMEHKKRNWMAARSIVAMLLAIVAVALGGCDSNPPGSCLDSGNPFCSNYVPPGTGGSGANTGGTGGQTNVNCGSLPEFVCFGECINLLSDVDNCGSCGRSCDNGQSCSDGHCAWNSPPDQCDESSESCNGVDDDCDGIIDEEFDLFTDADNCGVCGQTCADQQSCVNGHCAWDNTQNTCTSSSETCNGVDDDCDLAIDEPFNLLADANNCGVCGNVCGAGQHCSNGHCALDTPDNQCVPVGETCNSEDDDCDGVIDGQYNLLTDNANCGMCGHACANLQSCVSGHCAWDTPVDQCIPAAEVCDNEDNNCDGAIDETTNLLSDPSNCGTCGRSCDVGALCLNAVCYFSTPVDECVPVPNESCNSRDDNCNGWVDEGYNLFTDAVNCGMCGRNCGAGAVCDSGHCQLITPILNCTSSPEVCNYTDNDCDGEIDELINLQTDEANCGVCGLACGNGQVCDTGHCQWIVPPLNCIPAQEVCNGVDDDCDSVIDDGFSLLNDPLNCGACGRVCGANQHCENGACALDFPVDNCVPSGEICDNRDNNCNLVIDEGINLNTDPANCGVCGRVCPNGQVCQSGACQWVTPQNSCTPVNETCNNTDDDCDGAIDEGFVLTNDIVNCGVCGHACAGGQVCDNGHCAWITPPNGCTPAPETCNNVDDDCDWVVDDGFNLSNDPANCGICGFVCGVNQYCLNGHCANQAPVNVCTPVGEVCNNVDDNCNGMVDEGINLANDPANCGTCGNACTAGQSCQAGHCMWNLPQNGCTPAPEVCNNIDDDCDNVIDENTNLQIDVNNCGMCGRVCGANQHCIFGTCAWITPVIQCVQVAETCNNVDDDCDDLIDEGFTLLSDPANCGTCGHVCGGGQTCQNGYCTWNSPINSCVPAGEICNGIDDDCDLSIDEGFNLASDANNCGTCGRACGAGEICQAGHCQYLIPPLNCTPAAETCNNMDDDCDGAIDDGFNLSSDVNNCGICGRACGVGRSCVLGKCVNNVPVNNCVPVAEACNNIDDDCDNIVDENFALQSDAANCGICGHACAGGQHCHSGHCQWDIPQSQCVPVAESCDQIDNDCDGLIDENWNFLSDKNHCGNCTTVCPNPQICQTGHCMLP